MVALDEAWPVGAKVPKALVKQYLLGLENSVKRSPERLLFNLMEDGGRFAGSPESKSTISGAFVAPNYLAPYNATTFSGYAKFIFNNSSYGGTAGALNGIVKDLIDRIKGANYRRYGVEHWVMDINQGGGTAMPYVVGGVMRYLTMTNRIAPICSAGSWGLRIRAITGDVLLRAGYKVTIYKNGVAQTGDVILTVADNWQSIIWVRDLNDSESPGYNTQLFQYYMPTGGRSMVALPFYFPGLVSPNENDFMGYVPSLLNWG